jgi:hypothetical protein
MISWAVHGVVELPSVTSPVVVGRCGGVIHDRPLAGADPLPGRFVLPGLVDAHAHPAVAAGPGLVAAGRARLVRG